MRAVSVTRLAIISLAVTACEAPSLSGKWVDPPITNNSGGWDVLYLNDDGGAVTGKRLYGGFLGAAEDSSPITGWRSGTSFQMTFRDYGGRWVTFTGHLAASATPVTGMNYLVGSWIEAPDTFQAAYVRGR